MSARRTILCFALLAPLLLALAYAGRLDGEYVWDDVFLVAQNQSLRDPDGLRTIFTRDLWGGAGQPPSQLYHPLPMASFWAQARLGISSVLSGRVVNLLLHGLAGLLLLLLLLRWSVPGLAALLVALVFLAHPSGTEPVMWLTGRHDLLAVVFALGALWLWPLAEDRAMLPRALAASVCCAAAFLCKEPYIVVPAILASSTMVRREGLRRLGWSALPFSAVAAVLVLRRALGIPSSSAQLAAPILTHAHNYASIVAHYAVQLLGLSNAPTIESYAPLGIIASILTLALLVLAILVALRLRSPLALVGTGAFALALAPHVLSLPVIGLWGNRYAYFPLIALCLLAGAIAIAGREVRPRFARALAIVGLLAIVFCALRTRAETQAWHDDMSLYAASVEAVPTDGRALYHYGHAIRRRAGCATALPIFEEAARRAPDYARAWRNQAGCLLNLDRPADAVEPARRALALEPEEPSHHYNLGAALVLSGRQAEGRVELERALALDPGHAQARRLLDQSR